MEVRGLSRLEHQIIALRLSPYEKKQVNRAMGRRVATYSKQRIQAQQTVSGAAFTRRKQRGKGKMLKGLKSRMKVFTNPENSTVTWSGGKVAWKHQYGWTDTMTARKMLDRERKQDAAAEASMGGMASKAQAKALLAAGYRIPHHYRDKGGSRPSQRWIITNLSKKQAGKIIRILRNERSQQQWAIRLPARDFLGATPTQHAKLMDYLSDQILEQINKRHT
jgi:phage virion morphogenesis protein